MNVTSLTELQLIMSWATLNSQVPNIGLSKPKPIKTELNDVQIM